MASRCEEHQKDVRLRVMRLIDESSKMCSRQITDKLGIANGSAYYVLTALIDKVLVKLENFKNGQRKWQYVYLLTPKGICEKPLLTHRFIGHKRQEFEVWRPEIAVLEQEVGLNVDLGIFEWRIK